MTVVERLAESLARGSSRRAALKAVAALAFAHVAGFAAAGRSADAARCTVRLTEDTSCNPPWGVYCNAKANEDGHLGVDNAGFCDGSKCSGACAIDDRYYPQELQAACWCTALEPHASDRAKRLYWKCCDCACSERVSSRQEETYDDGSWGCACRERVEVTFKTVKKPRKNDNGKR